MHTHVHRSVNKSQFIPFNFALLLISVLCSPLFDCSIDIRYRKWKGGTLSHKRINKSEEEEASSEEEGGSNGGKEEKDDRREAEKKARLDDLWAGFKKETSMPNSKNTRSVTNQKERKVCCYSNAL